MKALSVHSQSFQNILSNKSRNTNYASIFDLFYSVLILYHTMPSFTTKCAFSGHSNTYYCDGMLMQWNTSLI